VGCVGVCTTTAFWRAKKKKVDDSQSAAFVIRSGSSKRFALPFVSMHLPAKSGSLHGTRIELHILRFALQPVIGLTMIRGEPQYDISALKREEKNKGYAMFPM